MDNVSVGEVLDPSYNWENGTNTGDTLDGVSTIGVKSSNVKAAMNDFAPKVGGYYGRKVVLVAGDRTGSGEDEGEVIIRDAKVIRIWTVGKR